MIPSQHPNWSATLLWFPEGKTPTEADFDPADENLKAEPYWFMHEALVDAVASIVWDRRPIGRAAWIKFHDAVLDEVAIKREFQRLHELMKSHA